VTRRVTCDLRLVYQQAYGQNEKIDQLIGAETPPHGYC